MTAAARPAIHLHLIAYSEASRAAIGPGWLVLDNLANPHPTGLNTGQCAASCSSKR